MKLRLGLNQGRTQTWRVREDHRSLSIPEHMRPRCQHEEKDRSRRANVTGFGSLRV